MVQRILQLRLVAILILGVAALSVGCSGLQTPTAEVTSVRLVEQTPDGASFLVTVAVVNPNQTALPLRKSNYTLTVPGLGEYSSSDLPNRTIPSGGVQVVTIPAAIAGKVGNLRGKTCTIEGSIDYEPPGEIRRLMTDSYIPLPTVDFKRTGPIE